MRYCYNCGAMAEHNGVFCAVCGGKIDPPNPQHSSAPQGQPVYRHNVYNTYNIYTQPKPENKPVSPSQSVREQWACPFCGAIVDRGFEGLCPNCGVQIKAGATVAVQQEMPVSKANAFFGALLALVFSPITLLMLMVTIAGILTDGSAGMIFAMILLTALSGSASYIGIKNLHKYDKQKKLRWKNHQQKLDFRGDTNNDQPRIM
ncbi:hypothetical protein SAMN02910447_02468 [Ruminococcus sp. YE71]|uniref:hypothetical protein n=1 Tax=unclassified Ruminococcus TaxID=2608920 RepID=UPI00088995DE|nr:MULTISPECIES: hypothetical protein [unclassified Ruminococcus]SDA24234.1 hypothetical protein SAMN02910446_02335 [Ruminococcus sp. YE78]SFW41652.1 hypothetical protein SAMN02910447_02468 [Ruminococcus sp. YE71]